MKRDLYQKLIEWKSSSTRKPLLIQGARQTGKTYLLRQFSREHYRSAHYFNFEEEPALDGFFARDLVADRIIAELSLYRGTTIEPPQDLIIFDEIQASNRALSSLKYFQESAPDVHLAAAGSLLGVKLSQPGSFPVGKVNFLHLYPLSFFEFLDAVGNSQLRQHLESITAFEPLPEPLHAQLLGLLRRYYFVGGMPEPVARFVNSGSLDAVRTAQREIINAFTLDFAKHAPSSDIPKLSLVWDSIPAHLARENKKFIFSAVKSGARARGYEDAIRWLEDAGLIHRAYPVTTNRRPLGGFADRGSFKVYALDVGLLGAMAGVAASMVVQGERLFNEFGGALVENYVAQQLICTGGDAQLHYWRSKGGRAELDFVCEVETTVLPLEVKAGINPRSKSLRSFDEQFAPPLLLRTTLLNLKRDHKTCNIPLYAINAWSGLVRAALRA